MNEQILIGILTEMKEMKAEMREMKAEMNDRFEKVERKLEKLDNIEDRLTFLEKSRKEDVSTITDILYSFEQGIVKIVNEEIDKRMYMQNIVKWAK